jgi:hypothetical protein
MVVMFVHTRHLHYKEARLNNTPDALCAARVVIEAGLS